MGVRNSILKALRRVGYDQPSALQTTVIPMGLAGLSVLCSARGGEGKSAAICIPLIQKIDSRGPISGLIVVPSDDMIGQTIREFRRLGEFTPLKIVSALPEGRGLDQISELPRMAHVVVGTAVQIQALSQAGFLPLEQIRMAVIDELDIQLEMGRDEALQAVAAGLPAGAQKMLLADLLTDAARQFAVSLVQQVIEPVAGADARLNDVTTAVIHVEPHDRFRLVHMMIDEDPDTATAIACRHEDVGNDLSNRLGEDFDILIGPGLRKVPGDLSEPSEGEDAPLVLCLDVSAKIPAADQVEQVILYSLSGDSDVFLHQLGRCRRLPKVRKLVALAGKRDEALLADLATRLGGPMAIQLVEGFEPTEAPPEPAPMPMSARSAAPLGAGPGNAGPANMGKPAPAPAGVMVRYRAPVFGPVPPTAELMKLPKKTLGGKFRTGRTGRK